MGTGVKIEIDQTGGSGNSLIGSFLDCLRRADEGDDRAIVIQVGVAVKDGDALNRLNRANDLLDDSGRRASEKLGIHSTSGDAMINLLKMN